MESLQNELELIRPGVYMASIDLKDPSYSILVHKNRQVYLTFFKDEYFKFVCMANGYEQALRIFTKTGRIPFPVPRKKGFLFAVFVDDSLL